VIVDAIALSIRTRGAPSFGGPSFRRPRRTGSTIAALWKPRAPSPLQRYQAYIVEAKVVGGRVSSAVVGLIAGGKDAVLVSKMCAKYGLNPNDAT